MLIVPTFGENNTTGVSVYKVIALGIEILKNSFRGLNRPASLKGSDNARSISPTKSGLYNSPLPSYKG